MIDNPLNRNRVKRGSDLPHAKLTEDDVRQIRGLIAYREELRARIAALTNRRIAQKFEVHHRTIDRISVGESWGHVE